MMGRRYGRRRQSVGAWAYPVALVFIGIGTFIHYDPAVMLPAEVREIERCEPLEWSPGMDAEGWSLLLDQGYTGRAGDGMEAIYPPGCEGI